MCYCANAEQLLGAAILAAENKIPQLEAGIKEAVADKKQLVADLVAHKANRTAETVAIKKATALRSEEAAAFAKEKRVADTNIAALAKATPAIEKGMGGFLQTNAASVLRFLFVQWK